ncbi:MAG: hypothetical protein IJZ24_00420 [Clostridia bacterium]|nr:hypothetical protein [Clostridia bacterium]
MTKTKSTKHALIMSVMALFLCFTMLLGTTFAWFTDSVTSAGNKIMSGTLKVDLELLDKDSGTWNSIKEDKTALFNNDKWEPGYTEVKMLKVENEGTLALKWKAKFVSEKELSILADVIDVYVLPYGVLDDASGVAYPADRNLDGYTKVGTLKDFVNTIETTTTGNLEAGESAYLGIALKMQESANNDYQGLDLGGLIDIHILATQLNSEEDGFGKDYDANAEYQRFADVWDGTADTSWYNDTDTEFTLNTAEAVAGLASLVDGGNNFAGKTIKLDSDIDLASLPFNPIGHSANGRSFNGVFDGQGHTISNMYEQSDLAAWQYEGEYYGLFAYTNGATIKNVTVADAYISSGRNEAAGVVGNAVDTTFSDITISNTTLIAYNNSAGGVAAECYGNCSFTNITVDEDTVIGPLWGTYDVRLGGVVGLVHAGNNVTFKDITVACQLDAINDVAANYQYWQYRYSGMLIGHVDGVNGVADPTGYVTCENVKVIYGDWVNYHYCEDADLGAGSYNGPGEYKYARVEAGTGTDGIDLSACNHNADESHNVLIVFDQLFGGGQGVSGLKTYDGVTVVYPNN